MLCITRKEYDKLINEFVDLDKESMINAYPYLFDAICCYWFRLPKRTVNSLFDGLGYGNWKHRTRWIWQRIQERLRKEEG